MSHHKHHVKKHHWVEGSLHVVDTFFETLEEAMMDATSSDAHVVKVYNTDGELVHTTQLTGNTYA